MIAYAQGLPRCVGQRLSITRDRQSFGQNAQGDLGRRLGSQIQTYGHLHAGDTLRITSIGQ